MENTYDGQHDANGGELGSYCRSPLTSLCMHCLRNDPSAGAEWVSMIVARGSAVELRHAAGDHDIAGFSSRIVLSGAEEMAGVV